MSFDRVRDSSDLLIAFGGMAGQLGMPPFEFFGVTRDLAVNRLFVRDLQQAWYQLGIDGLGGSIDEAAAALRRKLEQERIDRVVVAGTSAGGYAALLFGTLLGARRVVSIVPQTVVDEQALHALGDHRWDEQLARLATSGGADPRWSDLRESLPGEHRGTSYEVYFNPAEELDRLHAERLAGVPNMRLCSAPGDHNDVARKMRESGALERALRDALAV